MVALRDKETAWSKVGQIRRLSWSEEAKVALKGSQALIIFLKLENPHCPSSFQHAMAHSSCPLLLPIPWMQCI